jgi:prepilin signal peptidase PulO-like enzyme (type II secretory pathway)
VSTPLTLLSSALIGMAAGAAMVPLTRRQLAAAVARTNGETDLVSGHTEPAPALTRWHWVLLIGASGLLPGIVWRGVGGSIAAVPPLLLLLGLIQLAYCDASRRLLPKTLVYVISLAVLGSGIAIAWHTGEWDRLKMASLGGVGFFLLLFVMNLLNPKWMAFGDVRLAPMVGFGLAWIGLSALIEGFFIANLLAAVIGLSLIALRRADWRSALPFGLYLALGTGITILAWT